VHARPCSAAGTDSGPRATQSTPPIIFFDEQNQTQNTRSLVLGGIKDFLNAAMRGDRTAARVYAAQQLYKTATDDRTKLFESFLDSVAEETEKAQRAFVLQLRDIEFNQTPGFATTLLFIEVGGEHQNQIGVAPIEMIWFLKEGKPQCILLSDFQSTIKVETAK